MRYVLGAIGVVLLAFLAIFLLTRHSTPTNPNQKPGAKQAIKLLDYTDKTGSQVQWTRQGPLVGEDQRRAVRISISPSTRLIEILDGYELTTERSQTYPNTPAAYETFLHGLDLAGFVKERKVTNTDERGVCPLGNTFVYDLSDADNHPIHLWSVSCSLAAGPFAGNAFLIQQLFQNQIPDYNQQVHNVRLSI
jgi:hypothetical protein